MLFNANLNHSCTIFGTEPQGWDNRTDQDKIAARCGLAKNSGCRLVTNGEALLTAWNGTDSVQGYADILKNAGQVDSIFGDVHDAVNDVSDAIFYIDTITKDAKLATPLGVFANDCGLVPCVENVESRFALNSLQNIINNIQGLKMIFSVVKPIQILDLTIIYLTLARPNCHANAWRFNQCDRICDNAATIPLRNC